MVARSVLYTSTEPCAMCGGAIAWSGVRRVAFGCTEEALYAITLGPDATHDNAMMRLPLRTLYQAAGVDIDVVGPLCAEEAIQVHREYDW